VGADDFRRLSHERHTYREYQQWFSYHLLDGWQNVTTRKDPKATVVMVGPPRIRQIRHRSGCAVQAEMAGLVPDCFDVNDEDELPFGDLSGLADYEVADGGGTFQWSSPAATGDSFHAGHLSMYLSGGGYLLNVSEWLHKAPDVTNPGSEFYPFPHKAVNTTSLWATGWIDKQTKAIFHDFTLYSSSLDTYANVRLVSEFESNAAIFYMSLNLRCFWLTRSAAHLAVDIAFVSFLTLMVAGELQEVATCFAEAEKVLVERCVELKYTLRLRRLQFGAEHGIPALYQPRKVLRKLSYRLYTVDGSCVHHINELNDVGKRIPSLEAHYDDARKMAEASGVESPGVYHDNPILKRQMKRAEQVIIPHHEAFSTTIQPPYSSTKGWIM
jgi:hypothetical protein